MGKRRQTRRSISVKGITYQWIKDHCDSEGISVSGYIEELVQEDLDKKGIPKPTILRQKPRPKKKDFEDDPPWGNHFTF